MSAETILRSFVDKFNNQRREYWGEVKLPVSRRRGSKSPVLTYYDHLDGLCKSIKLERDGGTTPPVVQGIPAFLKKVAGDVSDKRGSKTRSSTDADLIKSVEKLRKQNDFKDLQNVQFLADQIMASDSPAESFRSASDSVTSSLVRNSLDEQSERGRRAGRREISEAIWQRILDHLKSQLREATKAPDKVSPDDITQCFPCSSLIYVYWLDEAGTQWAVERAAFRIENANRAFTGKWSNLHVTRTSHLAQALAEFSTSWQRGDLAAVQERQQMYYSLFGYPLFVARRGRTFRTPDPRHRFPSAFNLFLQSAMRYYQEERDLDRVPNSLAVRNAFRTLAITLREGNENLRDIRPPELRAQFEYLKDILGDDSSTNKPGWEDILNVRPGLREGQAAWTYNVDTIAEIHQWRRPIADDYRILAEEGETILVMVRSFDFMGAADADTELVDGLLQLLRPHIENYVERFKIVCGADLERQQVTAPPAALMAKRGAPPENPPWPRYWEPVHSVPAE